MNDSRLSNCSHSPKALGREAIAQERDQELPSLQKSSILPLACHVISSSLLS
ncbi:MAG: hypothetical protein HC862_06515 [Scytonema sp. RU_4_4]|nr:hypothetical protein [Scytonema sp. RU_4_4]NJR74900.1 hypothetical protein [Scytonema sp. CRU_2_7]